MFTFKNIFLFFNIFPSYLYGYISNKDHQYFFDYSIIENNKITVNTSLYLKENNFYEINFQNSYSVIGYIDNNNKTIIDTYDQFPLNKNNNNNNIFKKNIKLINNNLILNFTSYFDNYNIILYSGKYNLTYFQKNIIKYYDNNKRFLVSTTYNKNAQFIIGQKYFLSDYYLFFGFYSMLTIYFIITLFITHNNKINFSDRLIKKLNINYGTFLTLCMFTLFSIFSIVYSFITNDYRNILRTLGQWQAINLASVLFPITRNSIFLVLFKGSFQNALLVHKYLAMLLLLSVIIKFVMILIYFNYSFLFTFLNITTGGSALMGTIATISMLLLGVFSIKQLREKCFEVFYYSHKFFVIISLITSCLHYIIILYYTFPAIFLYLIDIILRYKNTKKAIYTKLKKIGNDKYGTSSIFIHITLLKNIKIEPGSYFFICYKDISCFEWHPLTVISVHDNNLIFCAKNMGKNSWTDKLINFNDSLITQEQQLIDKEVYLQGPYGHLKVNYKNEKYKYLICIAGGIGITPILPILEDINKTKNKLKNIKKILFVWIVSHTSLVEPFSKNIDKLDQQIFETHIYSTNKNKEEQHLIESILSFDIIHKRPVISNVIEHFITQNKIKNKEIIISCCGPNRLSDDILSFCSLHSIDLSNENF